MDLATLDKNFAVTKVEGVEFQMFTPQELTLEGFPWDNINEKPYRRLPDELEVSPEVARLLQHSSGGVIRFCTDSEAIMLKGRYIPFSPSPRTPPSGQSGFDVMMWENSKNILVMNFQKSAADACAEKFDFEYSCYLRDGMHEYRIYMPTYAGIEWLEIGLVKGSKVEKAPAHKTEKPILFYGSSVTQGACASRPSNGHAPLLAAIADAELINLGFSGNALGEPEWAEWIAKLDLSCFVMDYDHNAPHVEHLRKTHEPFFKIIREKHPDLPVIMISKPFGKIENYELDIERRDVVKQTYLNAREKGDENVYFVDGMEFFKEVGYEYPTADRTHPTDLGFYLMTKAIEPALRAALKL